MGDHHWLRSCCGSQDTTNLEYAIPLLHGIRPVFCGNDLLREPAPHPAPQLGRRLNDEVTWSWWNLLWKDHLVRLPESVRIRFLDTLLCQGWRRLVFHGEARSGFVGRRHVCAYLLHVL